MTNVDQDVEPLGDIVSGAAALHPSTKTATLLGRLVTLTLLLPSHAPDLFANLGGEEHAHLYRYLPGGPLLTIESLEERIDFLITESSCFPFTVLSHDQAHEDGSPTAIAIITLMNIVPSHRTIEIGHVLFGSRLQRTTEATEVFMLLMGYAFESLGYLRIEWKTNNFNEPSKRAALRLGFTFEGVFRKHMIIKGKRRDTAWFSCLDDEWGKAVKAALAKWLDPSNFDCEGKQVKKLEEFREMV